MQAPATVILGTGLYAPRLGNAPFDAAKTLSGSGRRIVTVDSKTISWQIPGTGITYEVPANFKAIQVNSSTSKYSTFQSSTQAITDIEADASLKGSYMGFTGDASVSYALQNTFATNSYIALFAYAYDRYSMGLIDSTTFPDLFDSSFTAELLSLPQPFDGKNVDTCNSYREFLYRWGTHIVTEVTFGQRFFFDISQSTSNGESYEDFKASVSAEYDGFDASIQGKSSFKATQTYKTFMQEAKQSATIAGGDQKWNAKLSADPSDKDVFEKWAGDEAAAVQDKPIHLTVKSLDNILRLTTKQNMAAYADDIQLAITYLLDIRETIAYNYCMEYSRTCMFVKVKDNATAPGSCTLLLSDDGDVKIAKTARNDVWGPPVSSQGFEYGSYGRSLTFSDWPFRPSRNDFAPQWDAGHLIRFNLTYGPSTTLTFNADENIEYVIFASGQGRHNGDRAPDDWIISNHVYWNPSTDPNPLVLNNVDLGLGASYQSKSGSGPRGQFAAWQKMYGA